MTERTEPLLMIVDDSKVSRMMIKSNIVKKRLNWQIIEAANGDEAIVMAAASLPDFITMDLNMPGIDGLQAAAKIKDAHPNIRIVMCTANFQDAVRDNARLGGLHFISKLVTDKNIQEAIEYFEG